MTTRTKQDGTANKGQGADTNNARSLLRFGRSGPSQRRLTFWLSFALCVLLPLALAAVYYARLPQIALPRARVLIRGIAPRGIVGKLARVDRGLASTGSQSIPTLS